MKIKIHGIVLVLFVLAGFCYAAHWMGAAIAFGCLGMALELLAWLVWVDNRRTKPNNLDEM